MKLLVIDNYDSFTYNLVQYLGELGAEPSVVRNDAEPLDAMLARRPDGVVISPGPGRPADAGVTVAAVRAFGERGTPLLGVCLGHQGIGEAFGGRVVRARTLMHGKTSKIHHDGRGVFEGLPDGFEATRYHSLVVEASSLPAALEVGARTDDGEIMALRHRELPIHGVQFHPESILTGEGKRLLGNFLALCRGRRA
jgi:anthranilate synthase component II